MGWPLKTEDACQDRLGYAVWIAGNVGVPEPDHRPPQRFQPPRPRTVPNRVDMLAPIELHRQPHLPARQIDDKPLHHQLPCKPRAEIRDPMPDRDLRIGRVIAQLSRTPCHIGRNTRHAPRLRSGDAESNPPPAPPFQGGGRNTSSSIPRPSRSPRRRRCTTMRGRASGRSSPAPTATSQEYEHR